MPYADYDSFGERYFEGARFDDRGNPAGYTRFGTLPYDRYTQFLSGRFQARGFAMNASVLVAGAAYGHTVQALRDIGYDAYGIDISTWAVGRADALFGPGLVFQGDITVDADVRSVRQAAGVGGHFDAAFTECVLECLTDAEAQQACANLRKHANIVAHHVYTIGQFLNSDYYNDKTLTEWEAVCDPDGDDVWFSHMDFNRSAHPGAFD